MSTKMTTLPETIESRLYWNLLKDLSETVRMQLIIKLKTSLLTHNSKTVDADAQVAYYTLLDKLNTYKAYTKGWDGEEAAPLTEHVISNFCMMLDKMDKSLLQDLTIYPEVNGTLLIDSTKREAGISLGNDKFSYYEINDGKIAGENDIPFSVKSISEVISRINK